MRALLLILMATFLSMCASAQCALSATATFVIGCQWAPYQLRAHIDCSGGTPPYTYSLQRFSLYTNQWEPQAEPVENSTTTHTTWHLTYLNWDRVEQGRIIVTDAMGCVAIATGQWQAMAYRDYTLGQDATCADGTHILLTSSPWMNEVPSNLWTYYIDSPPAQSFLSNWTLVPGSNPARYRSNFTISPGTHIVGLPEIQYNSWRYCDMSPSSTFSALTAGDCGVNVRLRAALDGALPSGTVMTDALRAANLLPTTEPYTAAGYAFVGATPGASIAPVLLSVTGNDAIVDWVVVELRSNTTTISWSKPALIQADGDVMDTDGDTYLNFPVPAGSYYVVLRHRNHLGVMTGLPKALTVDPFTTATVDLRSSSTTTYGTNARVQKGTVWCLPAGDATGNGAIKYTGSGNDRDPILLAVGSTTPNATVPNVYDRRDTNLDGVIKYTGSANDRDIILTNVGSTTPNNTRTQQLP